MKIPNWKKLYRDALFERDQSQIDMKIVTAKYAMHDRLRDLNQEGYNIEERKAVDAALFNIGALRRCLNSTEKRIDRAA